MRAILVRLIIRIVAVTTMPFGVPLFAPNIVRRLMLRPQSGTQWLYADSTG